MNYQDYMGKKTLAYDFIEELNSLGYGIEAPIDVEAIIKRLNIKYEIKPNFKQIQVTGSISVQNGEPYIWVNPMKNTSSERKRFTLAHELGHFMLHMAPLENLNAFNPINDKTISFNRDDNWDYTEMEANNFAAQLLMPSELIKNKVKQLITEDRRITKNQLIESLAKTFHVSISAMEFRLKKLGVKL